MSFLYFFDVIDCTTYPRAIAFTLLTKHASTVDLFRDICKMKVGAKSPH